VGLLSFSAHPLHVSPPYSRIAGALGELVR